MEDEEDSRAYPLEIGVHRLQGSTQACECLVAFETVPTRDQYHSLGEKSCPKRWSPKTGAVTAGSEGGTAGSGTVVGTDADAGAGAVSEGSVTLGQGTRGH